MLVKVVGKIKRPYSYQGKNRISCRLSLCCGDYCADKSSDIEAEGLRYVEVFCPVEIFDCLCVNDEIFAVFDDDVTRLKDAMIKTDSGYVPIGR